MAQPDFQLYPTFDLVNSNQVMSYYYRNGRIYVTNGDLRDELKEVVTSNSTGQRRATRIIDPNGPGTIYTTSLGNTITVGAGEQLWLNHNYTGNSNFNSRTIASINDSWWYDVDQHREFRVWLVLGRDNNAVLDGTTYYNWKVTNAVIEYNEVEANASSGTFRFSTVPQDPVTIEGTLHIESSNATWPTFSAVLYKGTPSNLPGSVLATETVNRSSAVDEDVTVSIELDPVQISVNDTITLAAQVDGTSGQIATIASPLRVTSYELSVTGDEGDYIAGQPVVIGGLGTSLDVSDDCDPLLNNVGGYRANERVQIIEYSESEIGSGSLVPFNLDDIRSGSAPKSSVPESYYTSAAIRRNRYDGSKFTRLRFNSNEHSDQGHLAGTGLELPEQQGIYAGENDSNYDLALYNENAVDLRDTHLGYFNQIIDPYPVLNGKTAYFVKYLINGESNVQDPSLSRIGNLNFVNTFKTKDINQNMAQYLPSIPNDTNNQELLELRETASIFKVGEYPHPVLWSQTSATTYTENLPLTGSQDFYSAFDGDITTYTNIAFNTDDSTVTPSHPIQASLTSQFAVPRNVIKPTGINYIGADNEEIFNGDEILIPSSPLTDTYTLNGQFTYYTTPLPTRKYRDRGKWANWPNPIGHSDVADAIIEVLRNGSRIIPHSVNVTIYNEQVGSNGNVTPGGSVNLILNRDYRNGKLFRRDNTGYRIALHSDIWYSVFGRGNEHQDLRDGWRFRYVFRYTISASQIRPSDRFSFAFSTESPRQPTSGTSTGNDGNTGNGNTWRRAFFPSLPTSNPDKAELSISLLGSNTANTEEINTVAAPYWGRDGLGNNQLELISSHLNSRYAANFFQGNLPYEPSSNPIFPASQEPSFTSFPGATDEFEILPGDEFRFENNEEETYTVTSVTSPPGGNLLVTFNRNITPSINTDFFLIRRYKRFENVVILNQQKPYSFPPSASSSPGILLPEFLSPKLETNPDTIITNLIERNLI